MRRTGSSAALTSEGPPTGDAFMACPICFEPFMSGGLNAPRVLDCSHSFCVGCINRWVAAAPSDGQIQGVTDSPRVSSPAIRQLLVMFWSNLTDCVWFRRRSPARSAVR